MSSGAKDGSATMIDIYYVTALHAEAGCERFFATVFSLRVDDMTAFSETARYQLQTYISAHLKPFLNRLETCLRYRILPVPVVLRRFAFCPHS